MMAARSRIPRIPVPSATSSKPLPSSDTSAHSRVFDARTSTLMVCAPEWRRALMRASRTTRSISVPSWPSGPRGTVLADRQDDLAVEPDRALQVNQVVEQRAEGPVLPPEAEVVDRPAHVLAGALERARHLPQRLLARLRCVAGDHQGERVRQVLERFVVQVARDPPALDVAHLEDPLVRPHPYDGARDHVRDLLQEVHVVGRERPALRRERAEDAERRLVARDDDRRGARHVLLGQEVRDVEALVRGEVLGGHGLAGHGRVAHQ